MSATPTDRPATIPAKRAPFSLRWLLTWIAIGTGLGAVAGIGCALVDGYRVTRKITSVLGPTGWPMGEPRVVETTTFEPEQLVNWALMFAGLGCVAGYWVAIIANPLSANDADNRTGRYRLTLTGLLGMTVGGFSAFTLQRLGAHGELIVPGALAGALAGIFGALLDQKIFSRPWGAPEYEDPNAYSRTLIPLGVGLGVGLACGAGCGVVAISTSAAWKLEPEIEAVRWVHLFAAIGGVSGAIACALGHDASRRHWLAQVIVGVVIGGAAGAVAGPLGTFQWIAGILFAALGAAAGGVSALLVYCIHARESQTLFRVVKGFTLVGGAGFLAGMAHAKLVGMTSSLGIFQRSLMIAMPLAFAGVFAGLLSDRFRKRSQSPPHPARTAEAVPPPAIETGIGGERRQCLQCGFAFLAFLSKCPKCGHDGIT